MEWRYERCSGYLLGPSSNEEEEEEEEEGKRHLWIERQRKKGRKKGVKSKK